MSTVQQLVNSLKHRGVKRTVQTVISVLGDRWFDWRYGTETSKEVALAALHVVDHASSATVIHPLHTLHREQIHRPGTGPMGRLDYQPARTRFFHNLLRHLDLPAGSVFVDLGAGKGRTLLMAAQHGFQRAVGVDFSEDLCEVARRNVTIFRTRTQVKTAIEVVNADVAQYSIRDDENVFFVSPFGGAVLQRVLDNITNSVVRAPRKVWFIYYNPYSPQIIDEHPTFTLADRYAYGGGEAIVYSNRVA